MHSPATAKNTVALAAACLALAAPLLPQAVTADKRAAMRLATRLDAAFNQRDRDAYLAAFAPDNRAHHDLLRLRLRRLFEARITLEQSSEVVDVRRGGPRIVATLRRTYRPAGQGDAAATIERWTYLALRLDGDAPRATLEIDFDKAWMIHVQDSTFSCPPCNYRLTAGPEWLCVPLRQDRTQCMEAVSFLLLGTDVSINLSVHITEEAAAPQGLLAQYLDGLRAANPSLQVLEQPRPWLPLTYRDQPPDSLSGAVARVQVAPDQPLETRFLCLGTLRFLLVTEGDPDQLATHRSAIDAVLDGFRLIDPTRTTRQLYDSAKRAHSGDGEFTGTRFESRQHRVVIEGPDGWSPIRRPGPWLFRLQYTCPDDKARLWVTAYGPSPGRQRWTTREAEQMVAAWLRKNSLTQTSASEWTLGDDGLRRKRYEFTEEGSGRRRIKVVAVSDDLLVDVEGITEDDDARQAVLGACASLSRY